MRCGLWVGGLIGALACACLPVDRLGPRAGPLPPMVAPSESKADGHTQMAGQLALAHGQRALARGEYAMAEEHFLRAVYALPAEPEARLGLAEVWLMLGLAQRQELLLERAHEAVAAVLAHGQANEHAARLQGYIEEMRPPKG